MRSSAAAGSSSRRRRRSARTGSTPRSAIRPATRSGSLRSGTWRRSDDDAARRPVAPGDAAPSRSAVLPQLSLRRGTAALGLYAAALRAEVAVHTARCATAVAPPGRRGETRGVRRRIFAVALSAAVVAGCGGGAREQPPRTPPDPGFTGTGATGSARPVDIGGRSLFVECHGSGSPTVVLEAGFGGSSKSWVTVVPALSRITRTCAYDRAGLGSSVAMPGVHDAGGEVADLGRLLARAGIAPPYVLVGHSYGGLLVRMFARTHQRDTAGMVLVDSMGADQTLRQLALWPRSEAAAARRMLAQRVVDGVDLREGEELAGGIRTLGGLPLVVITAGREDPEAAALPMPLRHALRRLWARMQDELAALSSHRVHVVALRSGHVVQSPDGQPGVVVRAVRAVVHAVRDGTRLPPCQRLYAGPEVRCAG